MRFMNSVARDVIDDSYTMFDFRTKDLKSFNCAAAFKMTERS